MRNRLEFFRILLEGTQASHSGGFSNYEALKAATSINAEIIGLERMWEASLQVNCRLYPTKWKPAGKHRRSSKGQRVIKGEKE